ncbi:hypothetical protein BC941DRAFT_419970 [Chlamydoabsidia padenii]|nr:hypothetical protein BC941DRAFT_419970 [Chlamydoabsidia padenii]
MSYTYPTTSLDSLAFDPLDQPPSHINEEAAAADLALWTNAKFTYDITPGQGLLENKTFDLDKAMYEHLAQYLDLDLTAAPTSTLPLPLPTTDSSYKPSSRPPTLLPKPSLDNDTTNLFALPTDNNKPLNDNGKRPTTSTDDRSFADDDKRRRNTAASARFRIKKKQKEQAMAQTVQEMTEKSDKLQQRVHELENEIKWLRELLLEKNANK